MAELSLDTIRESIAACNKNILKIRKYIRDNQASLAAHSTTQLNKVCKDLLPAGMQLKRNYGHLALRSVGGSAKQAPVKQQPKQEESAAPRKGLQQGDSDSAARFCEAAEYEYEYEEVEEEPPRRPSRHVRRPQSEDERSQYQDERPPLAGACNACLPPQYDDCTPYYDYNTMSNADLARQCFMPAAMARYRNRQWG